MSRTLTSQQQTPPAVLHWLAKITLPNSIGTLYASTLPGLENGGQVYDLELKVAETTQPLSILSPDPLPSASLMLENGGTTLGYNSVAEAVMASGGVGAGIEMWCVWARRASDLPNADPQIRFKGIAELPQYHDIDLVTSGIGSIGFRAAGLGGKILPRARIAGQDTDIPVGRATLPIIERVARAAITSQQDWGIRNAEVAPDAPDAAWLLTWSQLVEEKYEGGTDGAVTLNSGERLAAPFTLANDAMLGLLRVRLHTGGSGKGKVRVWSDSSGFPGSELAGQNVTSKASGTLTLTTGLAAAEVASVRGLSYTAITGGKVSPATGSSGTLTPIKYWGYPPYYQQNNVYLLCRVNGKAYGMTYHAAPTINIGFINFGAFSDFIQKLTDAINANHTELTATHNGSVITLVSVGVGASTNYALTGEGPIAGSHTAASGMTGGTDATTDNTKFSIDGSLNAAAADLADSVNNRDSANVSAVADGAVVTITAVTPGTAGNSIALGGDTHINVSAATLTGGTNDAHVTGPGAGWHDINIDWELAAGSYHLVIEPNDANAITVGVDTAAGDAGRTTKKFVSSWSNDASDMQFKVATQANRMMLTEDAAQRGFVTWGNDLRSNNGRLFILASAQYGNAVSGEDIAIAVAARQLALASVLNPHQLSLTAFQVAFGKATWNVGANATDPLESYTGGAATIAAVVGNSQSFKVSELVALAAIEIELPPQTRAEDIQFSVAEGTSTNKIASGTLRKERVPSSGGNVWLPLVFDKTVVLHPGDPYYLTIDTDVSLRWSASGGYAGGTWSDGTGDINFKLHALKGSLSYLTEGGVRVVQLTMNYKAALTGIEADLIDGDGSIIGAGQKIETPKSVRKYLLAFCGAALCAAYSKATPILGGLLAGSSVAEAIVSVDRQCAEASGWRGGELYCVDPDGIGSGPGPDNDSEVQLETAQPGNIYRRVDYDFNGGDGTVRDVTRENIPGTIAPRATFGLLATDADAQAAGQKMLDMFGAQRKLSGLPLTDMAMEPGDIVSQPAFGTNVDWRIVMQRIGAPHSVDVREI